MRNEVDPRSLRQQDLRLGMVKELPVKVVCRYVEKSLMAAARIRRGHRHILPTQVHVREQRNDADVLINDICAAHLVIRRLRRNGEVERSSERGNDFLLQFAFSEIKANACTIHLWLAIRVVVQIRPEYLPFAHPTSRAFGIDSRRGADGPHRKHIEKTVPTKSIARRGKDHRVM